MMGLGRLIYDYQTLIGAGIAVGAAYWAGRPVYEQLKLTQTQANGVLREMLLERQTELRQAREGSLEKVGRILSAMALEIVPMDEDPDPPKISEQEAHHFDMGVSSAVSWLRLGYRWRDSSDVELAKTTLIEKLDGLLNLLNEVHAPAHTDQVGEDYAIPDEEWEKFLARGEEAKDEVPGALADAQSALRELLTKMDLEAAAVSDRLRQVNEALIA